MSRALEQSLNVLLRRRGRSAVRVPRAVQQASASGAAIGTERLAIGAAVIGLLVSVWGAVLFGLRFDSLTQPSAALLGWGLYVTMFGAGFIVLNRIGARIPTRLALSLEIGLALVVALDLWAVWGTGDVAGHISVSFAATFTVLLFLSFRRTIELLIVATLVAAAYIAAVLATTPLTPQSAPKQLVVLAAMLVPALIGGVLVRRFRRIVQLALERVLVQSTVSAPRFAVGLLASEELARLDLAAEELLESVASSARPLPLSPEDASTAASLATELRLHLLEGRRDTWLRHAITESELLGESVSLHDPGGLAGLLDSRQRDALLTTVWLLLADERAAVVGRSVDITVGPARGTEPTPDGHRLVVPITVQVTGINRNQIDPASWSNMGRVGRHTHQFQRSTLTVAIESLVGNPTE